MSCSAARRNEAAPRRRAWRRSGGNPCLHRQHLELIGDLAGDQRAAPSVNTRPASSRQPRRPSVQLAGLVCAEHRNRRGIQPDSRRIGLGLRLPLGVELGSCHWTVMSSSRPISVQHNPQPSPRRSRDHMRGPGGARLRGSVGTVRLIHRLACHGRNSLFTTQWGWHPQGNELSVLGEGRSVRQAVGGKTDGEGPGTTLIAIT